MRTFILVSAVLGLAFAAPARETRQVGCVSAFQNVPNACVNNPSGQAFFSHPSDPTKFLQCDIFNRMYIIQCPIGEEFRLATSGCQQVAQQPITVRPVTVPVTTQQPTLPTTTAKPVVVTPVVTVATPSNPCSPQGAVRGQLYLPYAGDSSKFIECDLQGNPSIVNCPAHLVWDQNILSCVYAVNVNQTAGQVKPTPQIAAGQPNNPCTPQAIASGRLFFPHPDQSKYVQCDLWGDAFTNSCPARLLWNPILETCYSPVLAAAIAGRK